MSDDNVPPEGNDPGAQEGTQGGESNPASADELGPLSAEERRLVRTFRELSQGDGYVRSGTWLSVMLERPRPEGLALMYRHRVWTDSLMPGAEAHTALCGATEDEAGRIMRHAIEQTRNPAMMRAQMANRVIAPGDTRPEVLEAMGDAKLGRKKPH